MQKEVHEAVKVDKEEIKQEEKNDTDSTAAQKEADGDKKEQPSEKPDDQKKDNVTTLVMPTRSEAKQLQKNMETQKNKEHGADYGSSGVSEDLAYEYDENGHHLEQPKIVANQQSNVPK